MTPPNVDIDRSRMRQVLGLADDPALPGDALAAPHGDATVGATDGADYRGPELDPALVAEAQRQRRVALLLSGGGPATPRALRSRIDGLESSPDRLRRRDGSRRARRPWRIGTTGAAVGALAAAVIAIVTIAAPDSALTAARVADLWKLPAAGGPVAPDPHRPAALDVSFNGTAFPNYRDSEGWHAVGRRTDQIAGERVVTVYYATGDRRAAYTVVPNTRVSVPAGARRFTVAGLRLAEFRTGDRWVVVFRDHANSCVLTAAAPREKQWLVKLAAWRAGPVE
jgi:hypothetical protein